MHSNDIIASMAALVIRKLDDRLKSRLRVQAAHHGRSMEEEAREILRSALSHAKSSAGEYCRCDSTALCAPRWG